MQNIEILNSCNLIQYNESLNFMKKRVENISNQTDQELIWFLYHDHIYTQGTSSSENEIIKKPNIPVIKTNRGGKTTYHGPGQRIAYLLFDLNKRKRDIRKFINLIECSLIKFLKKYKVEAITFKDRIGIWVIKNNNKTLSTEEKIGAIGLRIKNWITYHGLSFNINPNLEYYNSIYACGLRNYKNTSLLNLGIDIETEEFDINFKKIFIEELKKL